MHRIMIRILGVSLFALLVASAPAVPGSAQATTIHENVTVPIHEVIIHPCTGEEIAFSGEAHVMFHVTVDASGGVHGTSQSNLQGVSGVGLTSGDVYRLIRQDGETSNFNGAEEITIVQTNLVVGPGPENNFKLLVVQHLTCNSNFCTAQFFNIEASCQ
ncbi:MAG TPA: hypothetical protein VEX13_06125 [Chloroflexia bacterium]|nr:hypothetical protein [Chloroflexia bacterium]